MQVAFLQLSGIFGVVNEDIRAGMLKIYLDGGCWTGSRTRVSCGDLAEIRLKWSNLVLAFCFGV